MVFCDFMSSWWRFHLLLLWPTAFALCLRTRSSLSGACRPCAGFTGGDRRSKKRLFLSAKGWQRDGTVAEDASLLGFGESSRNPLLPPDELPAFMLRSGLLQLQAFTARRDPKSGV